MSEPLAQVIERDDALHLLDRGDAVHSPSCHAGGSGLDEEQLQLEEGCVVKCRAVPRHDDIRRKTDEHAQAGRLRREVSAHIRNRE